MSYERVNDILPTVYDLVCTPAVSSYMHGALESFIRDSRRTGSPIEGLFIFNYVGGVIDLDYEDTEENLEVLFRCELDGYEYYSRINPVSLLSGEEESPVVNSKRGSCNE